MILRFEKKLPLMLLCFIPFLPIAFYLLPEAVNSMIKVWRMTVIAFSLLVYFKNRLYSGADAFLIGTQFIVLFSTILYKGEIQTQLYRCISVVGFIMMVKSCFRYDANAFLKAVAGYGGILSFLTALTMFLYYKPGEYAGGMNHTGQVLAYGRRISGNYYLLGLDNTSFFYIFPLLVIMCIYSYTCYGKIKMLIAFDCLFVSAAFLYVRSATASFCLVLMAVVLFISMNTRVLSALAKSINYRKALLTAFAFLIIVVFLRLHVYFQGFLTLIFNKSVTLTRRTDIWDTALRRIASHWFLGIGGQSDVYNYGLFRVNHVHNIILEILYEGGIVALACFVASILLYGKNIGNYRNDSVAVMLSGAIILFFLSSSLDFYLHLYIPYLLLILAESIDTLVAMRPQQMLLNRVDQL